MTFFDRVVVVPQGGDSGEIAREGRAEVIADRDRGVAAVCRRRAAACRRRFAQSADPAPSRFEAGVGIAVDRRAVARRRAPRRRRPRSGGTSHAVQHVERAGGAAGIDGRVGVRLSRVVRGRGEASYLKPQLRIAISGDAEGAAPVTASETIQQFTIGGERAVVCCRAQVVAALRAVRAGRRRLPAAAARAGDAASKRDASTNSAAA